MDELCVEDGFEGRGEVCMEGCLGYRLERNAYSSHISPP